MTNLEALEFIRGEISHEFSLLNGRVSWLTSCQSFLITAFVLSLANPSIYRASWLGHFILPILGLSLATIALPGILGAHETIQMWLERQNGLVRNESTRRELSSIVIERFEKFPNTDRLHNQSVWLSASLPLLMGTFWIASFVLLRLIPIPYTQ